MRLFDLLKVWEPAFDASKAKVHLARYNGNERPLDVFLEGKFDWWQRWQTKRNFQREFVVSLVNTGSPTRWLYAGLFRSIDYVEEADPKPHYFYTLERVPSCEEWVGRLYLESVYTGRPSYLRGETLANDLTVVELLPERLSIADFPGFKAVNLTKAQLDIVVRNQSAAWSAALSSVKGSTSSPTRPLAGSTLARHRAPTASGGAGARMRPTGTGATSPCARSSASRHPRNGGTPALCRPGNR